jgi:hypothetical protein
MKRVLLVLTVALVMAAMVVAMAMPAFAANCTGPKAERPAACKGVGPDQGRGSQQTGP